MVNDRQIDSDQESGAASHSNGCNDVIAGPSSPGVHPRHIAGSAWVHPVPSGAAIGTPADATHAALRGSSAGAIMPGWGSKEPIYPSGSSHQVRISSNCTARSVARRTSQRCGARTVSWQSRTTATRRRPRPPSQICGCAFLSRRSDCGRGFRQRLIARRFRGSFLWMAAALCPQTRCCDVRRCRRVMPRFCLT